MKKSAAFLVLAAISIASTVADPIDQLRAQYSSDPLWINGMSPTIDVPAIAPPEEVVAAVFARTGYAGKGADYQILTSRPIHLPPNASDYNAVLIHTGRQGAVVLLQYQGHGWWSRMIPVSAEDMVADQASRPLLLESPCAVVHADELEDDYVSTSVTLRDSKGRQLRCGWGENGVSLQAGKDPLTMRHSFPGDTDEQLLLRLLKQALAKNYKPEFDKTHDTIPQQLAHTDPRWFEQKAVQRMIKELTFRCKNKRQPTYEEADAFDKKGQVNNRHAF